MVDLQFSEFLSMLGGNLLTYLMVGVSIAVVVAIALFIRYWMRRVAKPRIPLHVYTALEKLVVYGIIILGVLAALAPLGIELTGLLIAGGILGIVIGFASQTVVSNFLSGIFLYIEAPFKVGDAVQIMDYGGRIEDISIMSTKIRTWDGILVRLPNDKLFNSDITNYSRSVARRFRFKIGISYDSDIEKARQALLKLMEEHPMVLVNPGPQVLVVEYGDSAIILEVRGWAPTQVWFDTYMSILRMAKSALDRAGVKIPFPQLDLHIKEIPKGQGSPV